MVNTTDVVKQMKEYAEENNVPIMSDEGISYLTNYCIKSHVKNILEIGTAIGYSAILMASTSEDVQITTIERDEKRYLEAIKNVKKVGFEERIDLIQNAKQMDHDIQMILSSDEPLRRWVEIYKMYDDRAYGIRDKDHDNKAEVQKLFDFCVRASDAGIVYAHTYAASFFLGDKNDPVEAIRRMRMILDSYPELPPHECNSIIGNLNWILLKGFDHTDDMDRIITDIINQGYDVKQTDGKYEVSKESLRKKSLTT